MKVRLVEVIEVEVGGVRRYFTTAGETIGIVSEVGAGQEDPRGINSMETIETLRRANAQMAANRSRPPDWRAPPFDPREGPRMDVGQSDEEAGE